MYLDDVFFGDLDCSFDEDDFVMGVRGEAGAYRFGNLEEDPEMDEYESLLELGHSLRTR